MDCIAPSAGLGLKCFLFDYSGPSLRPDVKDVCVREHYKLSYDIIVIAFNEV